MRVVFLRVFASVVLLVFAIGAWGQMLSFLGNTGVYLTGVGSLPTLGAYVQPYQTVSVTTQTYPISPGQSVNLIYTTDNFKTTHTVRMSFDANIGNNTQWYAVLGPLPEGSDVLFYLQATAGNTTLYDNNGGQNYGFISRYAPAPRRGAILQWFATPYSTILKRLPEVAMAGYSALYLPPPQKSGAGGLSTGYNPFDRFDLGDRLQSGSVTTEYGSTEELQQIVQVAHRLGLEVYADMVTNHNDDRASTAINLYPNLMPEDFHILSSANTSNDQVNFNDAPPLGFNVLNYDLDGLVDIAHEDGNEVETGPFVLPTFAKFNSNGKPSFVRQPLTPQYYPSGKPVAEDVREYLKRWGWFLTSVIGFDGFRIDAARETDPGFFATVNTQGGYRVSRGNLLPYLYSLNPNLFIFGEDDNTDDYEEREYLKTGMDLLDFPLFNNIGSLFNSNGYGSLGSVLSNGYGVDSSTGLTFQNGGLATDLGVTFVQSHDFGPPTSNNLAYVFTLTRPGATIVYFDGNNLQPGNYNQFPEPGRADSLGYGDGTILRLVDARARYGRGTLVNRYVSDNCYIYERQVNGAGVMLAGLNIRGDYTSLTETVQTAFAPGTVLTDLSGQEPNVTVNGTGQATITVPPNSSTSVSNNANGYVLYVAQSPQSEGGVAIADGVTGSALTKQTITTPAGTYGPGGSYQAVTLTSTSLNLSVGTDASGAVCLAKLDNGLAPIGLTLLSNTPEGLGDGFFSVPGSVGSFALNGIDVSGLADGLHVLRVRVFANTGSAPAVFTDFLAFFFVSRSGLGNVDGNLSEYGAPLVTQTAMPVSQKNRLDELFVSNDDEYLYLGFAGTVDTSAGYTNGLVAFLDTVLGQSEGFSDFYGIKDDSGPAGRLLSNSEVTAPSGFSATFGVASFRQSVLDSSPEAPFAGGLAVPPFVGAQAGAFQLNPKEPNYAVGIPSKLIWQPRASAFGPPTGLEVAIPLASLYGSGAAAGTKVGIVSYLCTTGETGTTLDAHDPARATLGGRPASISYITNQILPPQPGVSGDPGKASLALSKFATYSLKFATIAKGLTVGSTAPNPPKSATPTQSVEIVNESSKAVSGPFYLTISAPSSVAVTNATGKSVGPGNKYYIKLAVSSIAPRQKVELTIEYSAPKKTAFVPTVQLEQGPGIP